MKKSLIGLVAIGALIAGPAMAADMNMPLKAPPAPVAPVYSWTGLYLGINGGWGEAREHWLDNNTGPGCPPCFAADYKADGGIFGGQLGYRYQFNGNWVLGIEGTAAWADLSQTLATGNVFFPGESESLKVNSVYTATGQIGYAWNQALLYVKGGWADARTHFTTNAPVGLGLVPGVGVFTPFSAAHDENNSGWTVGVGLDYQIWNNFVAGIEYDHLDLGYGPFSAAVSNGGFPVVVISPSRLTIDEVVGRLSYKFNWAAAPIATRY
jgi:outer membrane immunogenic protein